MMRNIVFIILFFSLSGFTSQTFTRDAFYKVFQGKSYDALSSLIQDAEKSKQEPAYIGALYLKIAGLENGVPAKISTFKKGKAILDAAIITEPKKTEWRFLRFVIQEQAPGILHYDKQLEEDKKLIIAGFSACDKKLKAIITNYSGTSKLLQPIDLK